MIEEMNALAANYAALLSETRPEVIRDEKQNQTYIRRLQELTSKKSVTRAEEKLIALLALLIEDFEAKYCPVADAAPVAIIRHLMQAHGLRQKDLVDTRQKGPHQGTHQAAEHKVWCVSRRFLLILGFGVTAP